MRAFAAFLMVSALALVGCGESNETAAPEKPAAPAKKKLSNVQRMQIVIAALDEMRAVNALCAEAVAARDADRYYRENERFHAILYRQSGNSFLEGECRRHQRQHDQRDLHPVQEEAQKEHHQQDRRQDALAPERQAEQGLLDHPVAAQAAQSQVTARVVIRHREGIDATMRVMHRGLAHDIQGVLADPVSGREYLTLPVSQGVTDGR